MHIFLLTFTICINLFFGFHGKFDLGNVVSGSIGLGMLWIILFMPKKGDC